MIIEYLKENNFELNKMSYEDIEEVGKTVHYKMWKVGKILECEAKRIRADIKRIWKIDK